MKRLKLKEKPESPFNQGLRRGIEITAVAFVPILLWLFGMIGDRMIVDYRGDCTQRPAVKVLAPIEQEQQ